MNKKVLVAAAAAAVIGLGAIAAEARPGRGGHMGGNFSGFGGGARMGHMPSFGGGPRMGRMPSFRGGPRGGAIGAFRAGPRVYGRPAIRRNWAGGNWGGPRHHHRRHWRGWGPGIAVGLPYYAYYGSGYYSGYGCGWLYNRAIETGSRYWWDRYYDCID